MNSNTVRIIAIALVIAALIMTILDWSGVVIPSLTIIRTFLLVFALILLLLARRGVARS